MIIFEREKKIKKLCIHSDLPLRSTRPPSYSTKYIQIYPEMNLPVYHDAFLPTNHEDLFLVSTTPSRGHRCIRSSAYPLILILSFWLTPKIYLSAQLLLSPRIYAFINPPIQFIIFPSGLTRTLICQLIYCSTKTTDQPENKSTCSPWSYFLSADHESRCVFLRPVNEDGYIRVNDYENSVTWLIDVPGFSNCTMLTG